MAEEQGQVTNLSKILASQKPGTWIILNPRMTKLLDAGRTPEAAMKRAKISPVMSPVMKNERVVGKRPVIMQVMDPSIPHY
jgi:hypothetical protein